MDDCFNYFSVKYLESSQVVVAEEATPRRAEVWRFMVVMVVDEGDTIAPIVDEVSRGMAVEDDVGKCG